MSVNKTAEAILAGDYDVICEVIDGSQKVKHLQAMAKLWLLKDRILSSVALGPELRCGLEDPDDETIEAMKDALSQLAGKPRPIWEGGKWEQILDGSLPAASRKDLPDVWMYSR